MSGRRLDYSGFDREQEGLRETLCTLGNGRFATRGAAPEAEAGDVHYPGTYMHGVYDRLATDLAGHAVENEDLVNLPNWLPLSFRVGEGPWFHPEAVTLHEYRQALRLDDGVLERAMRFTDHEGRTTRIEERRLVSMHDPHLAMLEWRITPEDWSGRMEIRSAIDGRVVNAGVERYRQLRGKHLHHVLTREVDGETVLLAARTERSRIEVAEAARTRVFRGDAAFLPERRVIEEPGYIGHALGVAVQERTTLRVEKAASLYTRLDPAVSSPAVQAAEKACSAPAFDEALRAHARRWSHLWDRFGIDVRLRGDAAEDQAGGPASGEGGGEVERVLRLHLFHLLQTASWHTIDMDAGIPARGLHGEAYRGHVFWDELFILPPLVLHAPEIVRSVLLYRHRRLPAAREAATAEGLQGAMFPWQSGSTGREESQRVHLNPKSGRWIPDNSRLQRHVNAAVAYNVWRYVETTDDLEFLASYGAEIFLETARFWASIATEEEDGRFHIRGVMGPDEYHEAYPWRDEPGIDDNTYTNVMAAWTLWRAQDVLARLPEDRRKEIQADLGITADDIQAWERIGRRLAVPRDENGILLQFEGFDRLERLDWDAYRTKYGDIRRLDRILESEGDSPDRYQVAKQADVLMLFYLFSSAELEAILERLGIGFDAATERARHLEHYLQRTAHGSTLSRAVHTWVLSRSDRAHSWRMFCETLRADIDDVQGGTTPEGVHLGAMAATVDIMERCYTGLDVRDGVLRFRPALPDEVERLRFRVHFRGHTFEVDLGPDGLVLRPHATSAGPVRINIGGEEREVSGTGAIERPA